MSEDLHFKLYKKDYTEINKSKCQHDWHVCSFNTFNGAYINSSGEYHYKCINCGKTKFGNPEQEGEK